MSLEWLGYMRLSTKQNELKIQINLISPYFGAVISSSNH
jgi:hypothetical protein